MGSKLKQIGIFLATATCFMLLNGCIEEYKPTVWYQPYFPYSMESNSDTIQIGDTISFNISISRDVLNVVSGKTFYIPEEMVDHTMGISKIYKDSIMINSTDYPGAVDDFNVIALKGEVIEKFYTWFYRLGYVFTEDSICGSFQFVPSDTGIYVFDIQDLAYFYHSKGGALHEYGITVEDPNQNERQRNGIFENTNPENGYYLIEQYSVHYDTTLRTFYTLEEFRNKLRYGTFSVVVAD